MGTQDNPTKSREYQRHRVDTEVSMYLKGNSGRRKSSAQMKEREK